MAAEFDFRGHSALVVEDVPEARRGFAATLKAHGFRVEEADGVEAAKTWLQRMFFDLAWVDLGLQGPKAPTDLSGTAVVSQIRAQLDPTFILVVTVIDDADTAVEFIREIGADDYVTKDRLTMRPLSQLFDRIGKGLGRYDKARRTTAQQAGTRLFGPDGEPGFFDSITKLFPTTVSPSAKVIHGILDTALNRTWPLVPPKEGVRRFEEVDRELLGDFWSRSLGQAVTFRFSKAGSRPEDTRALHTIERGKLRLDILLNGRTRDEFGAI